MHGKRTIGANMGTATHTFKPKRKFNPKYRHVSFDDFWGLSFDPHTVVYKPGDVLIHYDKYGHVTYCSRNGKIVTADEC
jgi:hypothetical protein